MVLDPSKASLVDDQSCSFGPILYLDGQPYKATLAADSKSLSLDAWTEPMAELALPHSEQISSLHVAWEKAPGEWVLLKPGIVNGTAKVPPGNYRFYSVSLKAKTASGDFVVMSGTKRVPGGSIKAVAGETTPFKCGGPLDQRDHPVTRARPIRLCSARWLRLSSANRGPA